MQRPLGEALARSVVDKSYHDDSALYPGRGQLHQLTRRGGRGVGGEQMKVQSEIHALGRLGGFFLLFVFGLAKCERWVDFMGRKLCNF